MVKNIKFIQIKKDDKEQFEQLIKMWIPYLKEIDFNRTESDLELWEYARKRVDIQGLREDMHFELCFHGSAMIGFVFYAVDLGGIKNIIDGGFGYIMEFYVLPEYRGKGYGRRMFQHIEKAFLSHGAKYMYLTPSEVSGEAFWKSIGFNDSWKIDPDNQRAIYIKKVQG